METTTQQHGRRGVVRALLDLRKRNAIRHAFRVVYLAIGIFAVVAGSGLVMVGTSALFSATETQSAHSFTAGTVSVGLGTTSTVCNVTAMVPGDSSTGYGSGSGALASCNYNVKYTGDAPAYLGVDVAVTNGSTALFTGASTGLQFKVVATGGVSVVNGVSYNNSSGTATTIVAGTPVTNILLNATPAAQNDAVTFSVDYLLPLLAPNALQGGSASLQITFHAVQSANQTTSCTAGRQCSTIVWN